MKNILTSDRHAAYRQVLEVVGLRTTPLSRGQIFDEWHNIHSPKPNERKNYIYDVVKYLYVEGYLAFLLDKKSQDSESLNSNIRVVTIEGEIPWNKEENATYVKSDSSWRYQLTLKGLLFYLISTICHNETTKEERKKLAQHKIVKTKTINEVIKITSEISNKKQDLRFLNCFQVFDEIYDTKTKVDIILQIARELENLVSERTSEFLRDYVITRCYDEVTIKIADIQKS